MGLTLYLDENIPPQLAEQLRKRGFDVLSAHEVRMSGSNDEEQLGYASNSGRSLLTFDMRFVRLAVRWLADGKHHSGVVVSTELKKEQMGELVRLCSAPSVRCSQRNWQT